MALVHGLEDLLHIVHGLVKLTQLAVSQILVIFQVPLSSAIVITVVVTISWEVNPFWVTELIAHEVEVGLSTETEGNKSDHFVEGYASGDTE